MLRTLIIITLFLYVLYKLGVFRAFVGGYNEPSSSRKPDGKIRVDTAPPKEKKGPTIKGGEYVDYEEIK